MPKYKKIPGGGSFDSNAQNGRENKSVRFGKRTVQRTPDFFKKSFVFPPQNRFLYFLKIKFSTKKTKFGQKVFLYFFLEKNCFSIFQHENFFQIFLKKWVYAKLSVSQNVYFFFAHLGHQTSGVSLSIALSLLAIFTCFDCCHSPTLQAIAGRCQYSSF